MAEQLRYGDLIHLHSTVNKKYISAERSGDLVADRRLAGDYECFTIESLTKQVGEYIRYGDQVQIRSGVGRKLISVSISGTPYANRDYTAGYMETFLIQNDENLKSTEIITTGNRIRLVAHHNKVLACEPDGNVSADRSEWEYSYDIFNFVIADETLQQEYNKNTIELQKKQSQQQVEQVSNQMQDMSLQGDVNPFDDPFYDLDNQLSEHQQYERNNRQYQTSAKPIQTVYQQESDFFDDPQYNNQQYRPSTTTQQGGYQQQQRQTHQPRPTTGKTTVNNNDFEFDREFYEPREHAQQKPIQRQEKPQKPTNAPPPQKQAPQKNPNSGKGKRKFELRPTAKNEHVAHVSILNENGALIYKAIFHLGEAKIELTNGSNVPAASVTKLGMHMHPTYKIKHANGSTLGECKQRFKMAGIGEDKKFNYQRLDNGEVFKLTGLYGKNWKISKNRQLVGCVTDDKKGYILEIDGHPTDVFHVLAQSLIMILSRYIEEAQKPKIIQNFSKTKTMY